MKSRELKLMFETKHNQNLTPKTVEINALQFVQTTSHPSKGNNCIKISSK